jgi:hypothetical protein
MNNISSILTFHNTKYPEGLLEESVTGGVVTNKFDKENFGVLELSIPKENVSPSVCRSGEVDKGVKKVWDIVFSIDNSGSMSDMCSDNRSKMQHIIHTIKNMIRKTFKIFNLNICFNLLNLLKNFKLSHL